MEPFRIPTLPAELFWDVPPAAYEVGPEGEILISAPPRTDLFADPKGTGLVADSPRVLFRPQEGDFTLSARVRVQFASTFDAGVLILWQDDAWWGKLCFEYSPQGEPMIVSVVTRDGVSDDCNSVVIGGNEIYLRVARIGSTFGMHYSADGRYWRMVRYFTLQQPQLISAGFSSQSPKGAGCTATFSEIAYARQTLANLRDGS